MDGGARCSVCGDVDCHFHCGWCGRVADTEEPDALGHADDCPVRLNLFPVSLDDLRGGFVCADCGDAFRPGEHYTWLDVEREIDDVILEGDIAVCLACAVLRGSAA